MTQLAATLRRFLQTGEPVVLVRLVEAKGSTPREAGAAMLVTAGASAGTIGGGQMEYLAIDEARRLIGGGGDDICLDLPLGPAIGQCCGGHVRIALKRADEDMLAALEAEEEEAGSRRPDVFIFGAGHVGCALAHALAPLPFVLHVVETRKEELVGLPAQATAHLTAMPEAIVAGAPPMSAFVVLTHDHALDFMIAAAALARGDAAYVGMIGSATKRATFARWHDREGHGAAARLRLNCPIGGSGVRDKRPEVIAALVAAELLGVFLAKHRLRADQPGGSIGGSGEGHHGGAANSKT